MKLKGNIAVVTGAAQGIGKGIALRLATEGATIVIWDVQTEKAKATAEELKSQGFDAHISEGVDITSLSSTEAAAKAVFEKFGKIDILVNNAGIVRDASFKKMTSEQWDAVINVNLTGVFNCAKAVTPYMTDANYGRIINISSVVGVYGNFGQTNYVAAKAGVIGMTMVWGRELGKNNITCNAIAPGAIDTDMLATVPQELRAQLMERIPVRRIGQPADIANAVAFFASPDSGFVTGQTIVVDGGSSLGG